MSERQQESTHRADEARHHRSVVECVRMCAVLADRWRRERDECHRRSEVDDQAQLLATMRTADLIELEIALRELGVTCFRHRGCSFNPRSQECVQRVVAGGETQIGSIAQRLLPGYRQDNQILIRERVAVYVEASCGNGSL